MNAYAFAEVKRYDPDKEETIIVALREAGFSNAGIDDTLPSEREIIQVYSQIYLDEVAEFYKTVRRIVFGVNNAFCKIRFRVSLAGAGVRFRIADIDFDRYPRGLPG